MALPYYGCDGRRPLQYVVDETVRLLSADHGAKWICLGYRPRQKRPIAALVLIAAAGWDHFNFDRRSRCDQDILVTHWDVDASFLEFVPD